MKKNFILVIMFSILVFFSGCGAKTSEGLEFKSNGDGSCTWVGLGTCADKEIIVPERNGEEKVTAVGKEVLNRKEGILKVTLPDTVKVLKENAFSDNDTLEEIEFGDGLETIEDWAVCGCSNLRKANLPKSIKKIGEWAFAQDEALQEINIPEGVENVGDFAFSGTISVKKISIPASMNEFNTCNFSMNSLEELEFKGDFKYYRLDFPGEEDGVDYYVSFCKETEYLNSYNKLTEESVAAIVCGAVKKDEIKFNGKIISPTSQLEIGEYTKDGNMYDFEVTENQEIVIKFGFDNEKKEVACLKYEINEDNHRITFVGTGVYGAQEYKMEAEIIPFMNQFYLHMEIIDASGTKESLPLEGIWNLS